MSKSTETKSQSEAQESNDLVSIEKDLARVSSILSPEHNSDPEEELSENNLVDLLKQLDSANGAMDGVENKLDNVLGQLDSLLKALEKEETTEITETDKDKSKT
ncbi:hypothetical protein AAF712_004521 [Marasmius tenuissimus]|uniref:Uncharacterized protein n=1 Tax=Marasmius tenuissimus TaxID=585030 RepID=A0ABR3A469_9AGAR|nr:hypothetical protein PM082_003698 [Marasmius tenuissimus]